MTENDADDGGASSRGRPKDPERREAILTAARDLFLEHGMIAVSMDAIADAAHVSKRTIYSHFVNKQVLLKAVLEAEARAYDRSMEAVQPETVEELRQLLVRFGCRLIEFLSRPTVIDLGRLLVSECRRHPDLAADFHRWGPEMTHHQLATILTDAGRRKLLVIEDAQLAAEQLIALWKAPLYRVELGVAPPPGRAQIRRDVTRSVDVILRAYASRS